MSEEETFVFEGMSPEEEATRRAGMMSMIDFPEKMKISDRDERNQTVVDVKTAKQKKFLSMRHAEIDESLEDLNTGRTVAGVHFPKGEPVSVSIDSFPLEVRTVPGAFAARMAKIRSMASMGVLKKVDGKYKAAKPEKTEVKKTAFKKAAKG